ncbi:MAG: WhiB family transcriptional regulator [Chloroflexi bacterium]|nr:WhiB family transcriptional regulator [Chloroflexota bacterium]
MDRGACRGLDPAYFHPEKGDSRSVRAAKAVCAGCPVREECLEFALVNVEQHGIWGGTTEQARRKLRSERQLPRVCEWEECGQTFLPRDHRGRYHTIECRHAAKAAKRRRQRAA